MQGPLEEFCYDRLSYCPWRHHGSIRCQFSCCLGFIPLWLSSYTLQRKKLLLSCRSLSWAVRGWFCFPQHPSKLGFGYRDILCWAMQTNNTKVLQGWSSEWVFFSLKGSRFLDFVLFSFFIIFDLFQKSSSHTVISQRIYFELIGGWCIHYGLWFHWYAQPH